MSSSIASLRRLARHAAWLLPSVVAVPIVLSAVGEARRRLFWADEILTWYQSFGSLPQVISVAADQISAAPPFYFVCAWLWRHVFPATPFALRLLTVAAAAGTCLVMFRVLRAVHGALAAAFAIALAMWFHPELLHQSSEARFHVHLMLMLAITLATMVELVRQARPSRRLLVGNALAHAGLAMTHYFAPLYGAFVVLGAVGGRVLNRRSPWPALASCAAGWAPLLLWLPVLPTHLDLGRPTGSIRVPGDDALESFARGWIPPGWRTMAVAMLVFGVVSWLLRWRAGTWSWRALWPGRWRRNLRLWRARELPPAHRVGDARTPLLVCGLGFWVVPVVIFHLSRRGGSSLWLPRYFLPCGLGAAIVAAQLLGWALRLPRAYGLWRGAQGIVRLAQAAAIVFFLWGPAHAIVEEQRRRAPDPPVQDVEVAAAPGGIVVEHIHAFLLLHFHSKHPERYAYVLDLDVGIKMGGGGPLSHKIMATLRRHFPQEFPWVMSTAEYLASHDSFLVVTDQGWFHQRIEGNPEWTYKDEGRGVMRVTRAKPRQP